TRQAAIMKSGVFGGGQGDTARLKRNALRGTPIEAMMVAPELVPPGAGAGKNFADWSDNDKVLLSPLRREVVQQALDGRLRYMSSIGVDFADFADESLAQRAIALARDPATKTLDPEAIRQILRREYFLAVTLHEVGHNVGMNHNFRASYDSLN